MTDNPLEGVDWRNRLPAADGFLVDVSIRFEAGRISGSTGCNRYTGSCAVGEGTLEIGSIGSTRMACPPAVMEVEADAFARLGRSTRWELEADARTLRLLDQDGGETLVFVGRPTTLTGRRWLATGVNNGRGGVASLVTGTEIDALFGDDGRVTGSDGCRGYQGPWATNGGRIALGPFETSPGLRPAPEGAAQQADAFSAAMGRATMFRIEGDRLELRDEAGALQVAFRA
jgi:heat shock protein HslJ